MGIESNELQFHKHWWSITFAIHINLINICNIRDNVDLMVFDLELWLTAFVLSYYVYQYGISLSLFCWQVDACSFYQRWNSLNQNATIIKLNSKNCSTYSKCHTVNLGLIAIILIFHQPRKFGTPSSKDVLFPYIRFLLDAKASNLGHCHPLKSWGLCK